MDTEIDMTPELKQQYDLTLSDFDRYPLWIGVHNFDSGQPWWENADEQTYRPWTGPLPFQEERGMVLAKAVFEFADGATFQGYFRPVREDWDEPPPPRKMRDGNFSKPLQWSARRGGTPLSVLSLHMPVIFVDGAALDFHLKRRPEMRKEHVRRFYAATQKTPSAVFPVRFHTEPDLFTGIVAGQIDGFYTFPLDKPFEIDTGEALLGGEQY